MRQSATRLVVVACAGRCGRMVHQALVDSIGRRVAFCDPCLDGRGRKGSPHCTSCNKAGHNRQTCVEVTRLGAQEDAMSRKLVSTTVYLRRDQLERMKAATQLSHVPWAQYIRDAVDEYIRARPDIFMAADSWREQLAARIRARSENKGGDDGDQRRGHRSSRGGHDADSDRGAGAGGAAGDEGRDAS